MRVCLAAMSTAIWGRAVEKGWSQTQACAANSGSFSAKRAVFSFAKLAALRPWPAARPARTRPPCTGPAPLTWGVLHVRGVRERSGADCAGGGCSGRPCAALLLSTSPCSAASTRPAGPRQRRAPTRMVDDADFWEQREYAGSLPPGHRGAVCRVPLPMLGGRRKRGQPPPRVGMQGDPTSAQRRESCFTDASSMTRGKFLEWNSR